MRLTLHPLATIFAAMNCSINNHRMKELNMNNGLTHFDKEGQAHMVDVGEKSETRRIAKATGRIEMSASTLQIIASGSA